MVKLCLGSANFGSKYGIDNKKLNKNKILKIIKTAKNNELFKIDTSFEYYCSHQNLKKVITKEMILNSKILLDKNSTFESLKKKIKDFNKNSPAHIYSLLFHNQNDSIKIKKINILKKLKEEGVVKKIGVSLYDIHILKKALKLWTPDIIQIPINPFNSEFLSKNFLKKLKKKNITIFARSIFLRGILVKKNVNIAYKYKKELKDWFNYCNLKSVHPLKACLDFCKSIKELDFLIVGVQDDEELKQIIKFFKQSKKINANSIIKKKYRKIDLRKI